MTLVELREILMEARAIGRKVSVIVLSAEQLKNFVIDLPGKNDPFDLFAAYGIPVLSKNEVLDLSERA